MKKNTFLIALLVSISTFAQYSSISIGVNGGIPTGNLEETFSASFGFDLDYLYNISDNVSIGGATGLIYYAAKEVDGIKPEDKMYVPVAGSVRFNNILDKFYLGGDLGYAIPISPEGDDGGIYFKPSLGYFIGESLNINLFYSAVKKRQPTYSYVGFGLMFRL